MLHDALALANRDPLVRFEIAKGFDRSAAKVPRKMQIALQLPL
jgi:hypothetical protein